MGEPENMFNGEIIEGVTGVILVGGKSRRMGRDKAFLPWQGHPLFERTLAVCRGCFARTILVGDRGERFAGYGIQVFPDLYPGSALGGLYTGLALAETEYAFVSACDMPFPREDLVRHLCSLRQGADAVVPQTAQAMEPLFAVYAKSCLEPMRRMLEEGNLRVFDLYPKIETRYVGGEDLARFDRDGISLISLNTPEEVALLAGSNGPHRS